MLVLSARSRAKSICLGHENVALKQRTRSMLAECSLSPYNTYMICVLYYRLYLINRQYKCFHAVLQGQPRKGTSGEDCRHETGWDCQQPTGSGWCCCTINWSTQQHGIWGHAWYCCLCRPFSSAPSKHRGSHTPVQEAVSRDRCRNDKLASTAIQLGLRCNCGNIQIRTFPRKDGRLALSCWFLVFVVSCRRSVLPMTQLHA